MKKVLIALMALVIFAGSSFAATSPESIITGAVSIIEEMSSAKDVATMADTAKTSRAIAIVPSMVKAGFILGGEYGEGLILRHENGKWYGPSFYNIGGGSFGLQVGLQEVGLLHSWEAKRNWAVISRLRPVLWEGVRKLLRMHRLQRRFTATQSQREFSRESLLTAL